MAENPEGVISRGVLAEHPPKCTQETDVVKSVEGVLVPSIPGNAAQEAPVSRKRPKNNRSERGEEEKRRKLSASATE